MLSTGFRRSMTMWMAGALCLGLGLSTLAAWRQAERNEAQLSAAFEQLADRLVDQLVLRTGLYEYGLRGARGAVLSAGPDKISRAVFHRYAESRDLATEFPGASGFGYVRRVKPEDEAAFVRAARADGKPDFHVQTLTPHEGERFLVLYLETGGAPVSVIGLDIASEPRRYEAAVRAMLSGRATLSAPVTLAPTPNAINQTVLLMLPVFAPGHAAATPAERAAATVGWTYAPLAISHVLAGLDLEHGAASVVLHDVTEQQHPVLFFDSRVPSAASAASATAPAVAGSSAGPDLVGEAAFAPLQAVRERSVFGRRWRIELAAAPSFFARQRQGELQPVSVLSWGAAGSVLFAALVGALRLARERLVRGRLHKAQLATIVENSADAIIGEALDGVTITWNRAAEVLFGRPASEVLGKPAAELMLPEARWFEERRLLGRIAAGEAVPPFDGDYLHADGHSVEVSITAGAIRGEDGRVVGVAKLMRDIRERKEAERALLAFNERLEQQVAERSAEAERARQDLQNVLDCMPALVGYWDRQLVNRVANQAYSTWFGRSPRQMIGRHIIEALGLDLYMRNKPHIEAALRGEAQRFELAFPRQDGQGVRHSLVNYEPDIRDGEVHGFYVIIHDISEITEHREALRQERLRLANIIEGTHAGTWEWNVKTGETRFNERWAGIIGYTLAELGPADLRAWRDRCHPDDLAAAQRQLERHFAGEIEHYSAEFRMRHRSGDWVWVLARGRLFSRTPQGDPEWMFGTHQDITARVQAETALREAMRQAEAASAAKSMFLANVSHEIRTPMNAVIGVAHLLAASQLDADQRELLAKLQIAGRSLLGIINNVLDLTKIEAGEMAVEHLAFCPGDLMRELHQLYGPQAEDKGLSLELEGVDALPATLLGDALRLRQVLSNLLANAIKFTSAGRVVLAVARGEAGASVAGEPDRLWLRWSVRDTGPGIAPELLDKLFMPFTQADASTTRRFGGTGLGLSIVRRLVELMGGTAGVGSRPGVGSEFWVRLPFLTGDEAPTVEPGRMHPGTFGGLEVVVVEDVEADRRAIAELCRALGWHAVELATGEALREHFDAVLRGGARLPDALLVDGHLPGIDGLAILAELASRVAPARLPAALIVSAHERAEIEARGEADVVDQILSKPVRGSELFNAVNACVARLTGTSERVEQATRTSAVPARWLGGVQLLLVDDSEINLEVARRLLEGEGASVTCCSNGREALAQLRASPARFDAVLMDLQMPEMDGFEATRRLREDLGLRDLPVLALTAGALGEERRKALEAGMNEFVTKPLDPEQLVHVLRRVVERARGQPVPLGEALPSSPLPADWPTIAGIDAHEAALRLQNDAALFLRMLERLLREHEPAAIVSAGADLDRTRTALTAQVHKLRGSAGMLGMAEVHRLAGAAEVALRTEADAVDVRARLGAMADALERVGRSAAAVLAAQREAEPAASAEAAPALDAQALRRLGELLREQDLAALDVFAGLAQALRARWGVEVFEPLRDAIEALDFVWARTLLKRAMTRAEA